MKTNPIIKRATIIKPYTICIWFSDGHISECSFKDFIFNENGYQRYANKKKFASFVVDGDILNWNDYDMCFHHEEIYAGGVIGSKKNIEMAYYA